MADPMTTREIIDDLSRVVSTLTDAATDPVDRLRGAYVAAESLRQRLVGQEMARVWAQFVGPAAPPDDPASGGSWRTRPPLL